VHTSRSIAPFGSLEVATAHLGITADFTGPRFPANPWGDPSSSSSSPLSPRSWSSANPSNNPTTDAIGTVITIEEFREVLGAFPYAGFGEQGVRGILCGLCRDKPATTFDNFVGKVGSGREFDLDLDGKGKDREVYENSWLKANANVNLTANFAFLESLLKEE
jgi:hypothetical protein